MAIPITRAEYEAKFGAIPVTSDTSVVKKAPIPISRAEYQAKFGEIPVATPVSKPEDPGYLSRVATSFGKRFETASQSVAEAQAGKQSPLSAVLQTTGQIAGAVFEYLVV